MAEIYFGHHGDTIYDVEDLAQGLIDAGLTEKGKRQAEALGRRLRGKGIDCVYCSPLKRAKQTADIVCEQIGPECKVIVRPNLRPLDIGSLAGKKEDTVRGYLQFFAKRPSLPLPDGETFGKWYDQIRKEWIHQFGDDDPVIAVISHSRDTHLLNHWQKQGFDADSKEITWDAPTPEVLKLEKQGNSLKIRKVA